MIRERASISAAASMTPRKGATTAPTNGRDPYAIAVATNSPPVTISTSGYSAEIGLRHVRQRPRSTSHETTGTLSRPRIGSPHAGHADLGATIDSHRGRPWTTTIRNDPNAS